MNRIEFFGLKNDIEDVFLCVEEKFDLKYTLTGSFEERKIVQYVSIKEISGLGISLQSMSLNNNYIISLGAYNVIVREVPQQKGGIRYLIDSLVNPEMPNINFGGIYNETSLIAGSLRVSKLEP